MIKVEHLVKRYGHTTAVGDVTFTVEPGVVTGFLGPNGAGKSTTMRMIVGLDRPTQGVVEVNGRPYRDHKAPLREVGALLEAKAVHPGRSARQHLHALAATHGIGLRRVDEVIEMTGLATVAEKRVGSFSLGMGQRLGIATALLGDPRTVILDEPVNGLDPEGVVWVRDLVKGLAGEGRTVFLSSHLMSEMTQTADHLIVIGRGKILANAPIAEVIGAAGSFARVRSDDDVQLAQLLTRANGQVNTFSDRIEVSGLAQRVIAQAALEHQILVHELTPVTATLEAAYLALTREDVEFKSRHIRDEITTG